MGFTKICPLCLKNISSLDAYMAHIKNEHRNTSPKEFVKPEGELKWSFRTDD
jgi:hypothetical protein